MKKDITILKLLEKLKLAINFTKVIVVDYWDADLCAIGLMKDDKLVYISTNNYTNFKIVRYDFDLEIIDEKNEENINVVKIGRNVSENELVDEIKLFLDV